MTNKKQRRDGGQKHEAEPVGVEPPVPPVTDGGQERAPSATLAASVALAALPAVAITATAGDDDDDLGMNFDGLAD